MIMKRNSKRSVAQMRAKASARKTKPKASPAAKRASTKSSREKVRAYRQRMRAKGLRLVQMWLLDTRTPEFAELAHRASVAIANSPTEQEDQAFIDSVQWWTSEEAEALSRSEPEGWWKEPSD
jgi:Antitoxin MazE-like